MEVVIVADGPSESGNTPNGVTVTLYVVLGSRVFNDTSTTSELKVYRCVGKYNKFKFRSKV